MRLNLGCGRSQLPTHKDDPFTEHLRAHLPASAYTQEWVNVDRVSLEGIDEIVDLFAYPWIRSSNGQRWAENSVDEIWASHIIEHIPHEAVLLPEAALDPAIRQASSIDGWYAWFYEAWRILKPGGIIHIVAPFAASLAGVIDPTHRRMVAPQSFSYFVPNPDAPFDYQIPCQFIVPEAPRVRIPNLDRVHIPEGADSADIITAAGLLWNGVDEFYLKLQAVK